MASTNTTFAALLKTRYDDSKIEKLTASECPLLEFLPKSTDGGGDGQVQPLIYGNPRGIGGTVAGAQANTTNLLSKKFILTYGEITGSVDIGDKVMRASKSNLGAFLENSVAEIDGLYTTTGEALCTMLYGNGGLSIGKRASLSTNTVTLSNPYDAFNFEVGDIVSASSADGSGSSDAARSGTTYVTAVDRTAGTVTLNSAAAITSFADNDYLFKSTLFAGNTAVSVIAGLGAFIASSDTPADLYSMVRTPDPTRLAGCRVPSTALTGRSIIDRIRLLGAYMGGRYKARGFDRLFLNPEDWQTLETALAAQGTRSLTDEDSKFGFMKLECTVGGRKVKIYSDPFCTKGTAFLINTQSWKLRSMGKLIGPLNGDGLEMRLNATANQYEYRTVSYPNLSTNAPGNNGRVSV